MPTTDDDRGTGVSPVEGAGREENHGRDGHATGDGPVRIRRGAYLPHWTRERGIYFVTFRLADSLPQSVVGTWQGERTEIIRRAQQQGRPLSHVEQDRLKQLFSERVEKFLDAGQGACWMNRPEIADLVAGALHHFDGQRYALLAWCVMPNHVHVVLQPFQGHELSAILHSWKSFTAHEAVKKFNVPAPFWQPEPYDHLIRDDDDLIHAVEYTLDNPRAAGLQDWRWVGRKEDIGTWLLRGTGVPPVEGVGREENHGRDGHATTGEADADD